MYGVSCDYKATQSCWGGDQGGVQRVQRDTTDVDTPVQYAHVMHTVTCIYIHNAGVYIAAQAVTSNGNSSCLQSPQASLLPRPFHLETARDHKSRQKKGNSMLGCSEFQSSLSPAKLHCIWPQADFLWTFSFYTEGTYSQRYEVYFSYICEIHNCEIQCINTYIFVIIYI